jgi:hypothetical protein
VEARSIGGNSGSPVFFYVGRYNSGAGPFRRTTDREYGPWLLGVDWGHLNDWEPVCDAKGRPINPARPQDTQVRMNTGMMAVVPAWKLAELLDEGPFAEHRKRETEKAREEMGKPPALPPATSD